MQKTANHFFLDLFFSSFHLRYIYTFYVSFASYSLLLFTMSNTLTLCSAPYVHYANSFLRIFATIHSLRLVRHIFATLVSYSLTMLHFLCPLSLALGVVSFIRSFCLSPHQNYYLISVKGQNFLKLPYAVLGVGVKDERKEIFYVFT